MRVLRNVDLAVLVIALPIFLVADINIIGWITGAGLYVGQKLVRAYAIRRAERADDPRTTVGLLAASMLARGWIVAGTILAVGLTTESEVGLAAAVTEPRPTRWSATPTATARATNATATP